MKDPLTTLKEFGPTVTVSLFIFIFFSVETRKAKYQRFLWRPRNPKKQNKVYTSTYFVKHIYHRTKIRLDLSLKKKTSST